MTATPATTPWPPAVSASSPWTRFHAFGLGTPVLSGDLTAQRGPDGSWTLTAQVAGETLVVEIPAGASFDAGMARLGTALGRATYPTCDMPDEPGRVPGVVREP